MKEVSSAGLIEMLSFERERFVLRVADGVAGGIATSSGIHDDVLQYQIRNELNARGIYQP